MDHTAQAKVSRNLEDHAGHDHSEHDDHVEGETQETSFTNATDGGDAHDDDSNKPWAEVIIASLIINLASISGLFGVVIAMASKKQDGTSRAKGLKFRANIIPSFACGALLATTVFLIIPESLQMILGHLESQVAGEDDDSHNGHDHRFLEEGDDHGDHGDFESAVAFRFGTCLLAGFLIPVVTGMFFPHYHELGHCDESVEAENPPKQEIEEKEEKDSIDQEIKTNFSCDGDCCQAEQEGHSAGDSRSPINYPLAGAILIGDFFHNFTDGIFVGTGFMLCTYDLAITIALATIYHEIAQEVADFYILTKHCHLKTSEALVLNFIGGLSVMMGGLVVLLVNVNSMVAGCILTIGGGVYVHNAAAECFPIAKASHDCLVDKLVCLFSFFIGAVPIGLVLLNHFHCGGH